MNRGNWGSLGDVSQIGRGKKGLPQGGGNSLLGGKSNAAKTITTEKKPERKDVLRKGFVRDELPK